ncbi:MAG: hypothetical protein KDF64_03970 [Geminicoccaceae bacterium]|nr:hypothetical protein [Geminicoccaceae bacterium]
MSWLAEIDSLASDPCDKSDKTRQKGVMSGFVTIVTGISGEKMACPCPARPRIQLSPKLNRNRSTPDGGQTWHPTKKGVSLKRGLLPELIEALRATEKGDC